MQRSRVVRAAVSLTALTAVAAGGAYALDGGGRATAGGGTATAGGGTASPRMDLASYRSFSGCDDLLTYLRARALPLVGPFGLDQPGLPVGRPEVDTSAAARAAGAVPAPAPAPTAAAAADGAAAKSGTGTNVQVAGVDEADVTKKVGDLVLTVAAGDKPGLTVLRAGDGRMRVLGRLATDWRPDDLLVQGSTVLLIGSLHSPGRGGSIPVPGVPDRRLPVPSDQTSRVRVAEVDVADPARPRLVRTLDLDGDLVGARLAGGVVRLAVSAVPSRLRFVTPDVSASGPGAQDDTFRKALDANRRVVRTSPVSDWLPRWTLTPAGGRPTGGSLLECDRVGVPAEFSGLGTLAMLTFDLRSGGVDRWDGSGVVASGTTLYSSGDRTYVATRPWVPMDTINPTSRRKPLPVRPPQERTLVHAFETAAGGVRYLGSGTVDGTLLGQYAMDEYQGHLRVATTIRPGLVDLPDRPVPMPPDTGGSGGAAPPAAEPGDTGSAEPGNTGSAEPGNTGSAEPGSAASAVVPAPKLTTVPRRPDPVTTSSSVTVLQLRNGRLERVGRVDGLGPDEVIHGVRFAGPRAYVVTFKQTDPLFVVDLADPARPRVAGSLHLLGYSAYLHPLGDGLLLGIGQDATATGERTGLLMSLFDVSDPARPRLLDKVSLPGAWPQVENDAHAFTYAGGLALVPLDTRVAVVSSDGRPVGPVDPGVLAVRVEGRRLGTPTVLQLGVGRNTTGVETMGLRTFVDGGALWTVAPATPRAVASVHDAGSLRWLSGTSF